MLFFRWNVRVFRNQALHSTPSQSELLKRRLLSSRVLQSMFLIFLTEFRRISSRRHAHSVMLISMSATTTRSSRRRLRTVASSSAIGTVLLRPRQRSRKRHRPLSVACHSLSSRHRVWIWYLASLLSAVCRLREAMKKASPPALPHREGAGVLTKAHLKMCN